MRISRLTFPAIVRDPHDPGAHQQTERDADAIAVRLGHARFADVVRSDLVVMLVRYGNFQWHGDLPSLQLWLFACDFDDDRFLPPTAAGSL